MTRFYKTSVVQEYVNNIHIGSSRSLNDNVFKYFGIGHPI